MPIPPHLINFKPVLRDYETDGAVTLAHGESTSLTVEGSVSDLIFTSGWKSTVTGTYDSNTKMLGLFNGTNGSQSISFATGQTPTVYGSTQISTANSPQGGGSLLFNGSGDYMTLPDDDTLYNRGTSPWTLEGRLKFNSVSGNRHIVNLAGPGEVYAIGIVVNNGNLFAFVGSNTTRDIANDVSFGTVGTTNYHHFALTRSGNTFLWHLDGVYVTSVSSSAPLMNVGGGWTFARPNSVGVEFGSYQLDWIRFSHNARYSASNFTPPTESDVYGNSESTVKVKDGAGGLIWAYDGASTLTVTNDTGSSGSFRLGALFCSLNPNGARL